MGKTDKFILDATLIHGSKYCYRKVEYINSKVKVIIVCKAHGEFLQSPVDHKSGQGCPKCGTLKSSDKRRKTLEKFLKQARNIHGDRFLYDKVEYISRQSLVTIVCRIHGDFQMTPCNHISHKKSCSKCSSIRASRQKIKNILKQRFENILQPEDYKIIPLKKGFTIISIDTP